MSGVILYGAPAPGLVDVPAGAVQTSPLILGSADLSGLPDGSAEGAVALAPPGTLERDFVLAQILRAVKPGGAITVLAPKDKGGSRLRKALEGFGCAVTEDARRHHRFCFVTRPPEPLRLRDAIAAGAPRLLPDLGLWSQPGVFSWDRLDPGSARLLELMPDQAGQGADLGCGIGVLAARVLASKQVTDLACLDIDRRAVACAQHNLDDRRASIAWADVRTSTELLTGLDFVVMNPPFHDGGSEDKALGVAFLQAAAGALRKGGTCWMVANRHLPYEAVLAGAFSSVETRGDAAGYKIFEARK